MRPLDLSYVIPAYNEERHLPRLLDSIKLHSPPNMTYEIIVADHGSEDNTVKEAEQHGARVVPMHEGTVAGLRNAAANLAKGSVFIFLDADIALTAEWTRNFSNTYQSLADAPLTVTGSLCGVPENPSLIERFWFAPLQNKGVRYINSGHLITTRKLFEHIGGFNASLQTGEDYDFSMRARANGARIINNPSLRVIHYGYPSTLAAFVRREIWHGKGDCQNWKTLLHSKVAMASVFFTALHIVGIIGLLFSTYFLVGMTALVGIISLCAASAVFKHNPRTLAGAIVATGLYYCYFSARSISCLQTLIHRVPAKQQRS